MTDLRLAPKPTVAGGNGACPNTAEVFEGLLPDAHKGLARSLFALRRGPVRYSCGQTIVIQGDASEYISLVISGVVRSFRSFQDGRRGIVSFYLPTEFFGLTNQPRHLLTAEAAADANILFFKRAALVALAERESRIANFLLMTTQLELQRMQEHSLLINRDAKGRLASFLIDLSERIGTQTWLDLPMSHLDIADHLGLTIETLSRIITQMENSGAIVRGRSRRLFLNNRQALTRMAN
jgi:CRP/FNR family nitrogen fixation transcriptional regulator